MVTFDAQQSKIMGMHTELTILAAHAHGISQAIDGSLVELPESLIDAAYVFLEELENAVTAHSKGYKRIKE